MEPFDLSLNQVNLEEKDLTEQDSLNAFSDVYCYESDFQTKSQWLPVQGKKIPKRNAADSKAGLIDLIHESNRDYYTHGGGRAGSHNYRLPDTLTGDSKHPESDQAQQAPSHDLDLPEKSRDLISGNSLQAFMDTVDALALQTSVLGTRNVLSPEAYAKLTSTTEVTDERTRELLNSLTNGRSNEDSSSKQPSTNGTFTHFPRSISDDAGSVTEARNSEQIYKQFRSQLNASLVEERNGFRVATGASTVSTGEVSEEPAVSTITATTHSDVNSLNQTEHGTGKLLNENKHKRVSEQIDLNSRVSSNTDSMAEQDNSLTRNVSQSADLIRDVSQSDNQTRDVSQSVNESRRKSDTESVNSESHVGAVRKSSRDENVESRRKQKQASHKRSGSSVSSTSSTCSEHKLIPVPKAEITTTIEKSPGSSWFRRAACSNPRVPVEDRKKLTVDKTEVSQDEESKETHESAKPEVEAGSDHVTLCSEETLIARESGAGRLELRVWQQLVNASGQPVTEGSIETHTVEKETEAKQGAAQENPKNLDSTEKEKMKSTRQAPTSKSGNKKQVASTSEDSGTFVMTPAYDFDPTAQGNYGALKRQLDTLMRARAKLEGQLEIMQAESNASLQQRTQLQAEVGALQQQLKAQEMTVAKATEERDALLTDMLTMKETRVSLEQVIVDNKKFLEEKDAELRTAQEDLRLSRDTQEKLQEAVRETKRELTAKHATAEDLKNKIAELYVQFETANQTRLLQERELESARAELRSQATARDWYQQQLQLSTHTKHQLQRDLTNVKGELMGKVTLLERIKAENVRLQQALGDTNQRIIQEKQLLAGQLEAIEADILEREAAFTQIRRERDALSAQVHSLGHKPEHSHQQATETESELTSGRLQNDVRRKQAQIAVLEHEQAELVKRLTLCQESLLERDQRLERLDAQVVEDHSEARRLQHQLTEATEQADRWRQECELRDRQLRAHSEERTAFDDVIKTLKGDMTKVETSFQRIKQELARKTDELNVIKQEKDKQNTLLATQSEKAQLQPQSTVKSTVNSLVKSVENRVSSNSSEVVPASKPGEGTPARLADIELIQNLNNQVSALQQNIDTSRQQYEHQIETLKDEKGRVEKELLELKELYLKKTEGQSDTGNLSKVDFDKLVQDTIKEVTESCGEYVDAGLQDSVYLTKAYSKADSDNTTSDLIDENCKLKWTIVRLQRSQESNQQPKSEKSGSVEDSPDVSALKGQNAQLEAELSELRVVCSRLESSLAEHDTRAEKQREELETRLADVAGQLEKARQLSNQSDADKMLTLSLELEKERGKLAGIVQQYSQLKQHSAKLEAQFASQQSERVGQSLSEQQVELSHQRTLSELQAEKHSLQVALNKQNGAVKEVKKQLMTEKGNHVKTRRRLEGLSVDHAQMRADYDKTLKQLEELQSLLQKSRERENGCREEQKRAVRDLQETRAQLAEVHLELYSQRDRDPVMNDKIQTLEWQLREREQELEATRQQIKLAEDRLSLEASNMRAVMQSNSSELSRLREDLTGAKREKAALQTRVIDLKNALQTTVQHGKAGSGAKVDFSALEQLLKEASSPATQSKPLSFIQATLTELRGEITALQSHMDEHTSALQSSTLAWKELEKQVADLRDVCKTTAAERKQSQNLIPPVPYTDIPTLTLPPALQSSLASQNSIDPKRSTSVATSSSPHHSSQVSPAHSVTSHDPIVTVSATSSTASSRQGTPQGTPERRINTKAMELNSVFFYAPKK